MKNRNGHSLWLLLLLPCLHGCVKDEPRTTHIKGRVTEYGTEKPVAGARIYLLCDQSVVFGSSGSSLADSLVTDTDGRFDRTYSENELCGSLYLLPYKQGYIKGTEIDLTTTFKELEVVLDPEAWLKVVTVPDGPNNYGYISVGGDFSFETTSNQGTKETYFAARGNREIFIVWAPFTDPSENFSEHIFIPGHDTTTYTIHY